MDGGGGSNATESERTVSPAEIREKGGEGGLRKVEEPVGVQKCQKCIEWKISSWAGMGGQLSVNLIGGHAD